MNSKYEQMIIEQNAKELKYFRISDIYFPKYKEDVLTGKFYARHEALDLLKADPVVVDTIKTYLDKGPKEKYVYPGTENQKYGWFSNPLVEVDRNDERYYFPSRKSEIMKHEMMLKREQHMHPLKFTGIPWK